MSTVKFKLKNGMEVLLIESHKSPVVSVQAWVRTGSADERKGEEGISHFIEHLVFKGTRKYGVGEIASTVEASGGELNAYTSFDQTVFYVTISKQFSDVALDVISEMMGHPKFDAQEIDNEREVVIEEIKRGNDSPGRQVSQMLFSTVYKTHPYGIPVIGFDKLIKKVSRKTLTDYYHSRYVPSNMHLVIAGDFNSSEMRKKVTELFGAFKVFKLRKVVRKREAAQKAPRVSVKKAPFEEAQSYLAWRIPGAIHKDVAALDVLGLILGQGDSSRLTKRLRLEKAVTNSIGAGTYTPKDSGLFMLSLSLNPENLEEAFAGVQEELSKALSTLPLLEELQKAIVNFESEEFYSLETVDAMARKAGSLENMVGDHRYFEKYLKQIHALKPEDLLRVARKYLKPETLSLVLMTPRRDTDAKKFFKSWLKSLSADYNVASKAKPKPLAKSGMSAKSAGATKGAKKSTASKLSVKPAAAKKSASGKSSASRNPADSIEKVKLDSGLTVIFRPNDATPIISAKAAVLGGVRVEPEQITGVSDLLSRVWTSGTPTKDENAVQLAIENMAAGLSAFSGRNSVGMSLQVLTPFEEQAADLFFETLTSPTLPESAIEREKLIMLEGVKSREDNPAQVASQMFLERIFAGHPYAREVYGTRESIAKMNHANVQQHFKKMVGLQNMTIVVAGNADRKLWMKKLEQVSKSLQKGVKLEQHIPSTPLAKSLHDFKSIQREQSHIIYGFPGLTINDPRRYALQLIQSVLAGQGGRLFLELRDKASLAYSVSPMRMEGLETGYFGAYIGCSPEKGKTALQMMDVEFRKLVDHKVDAAEISRAKRYLIGRHDIDLQRNSSIGSGILFNEIYGISGREIFDYATKINQVTAQDVQDLASEIFSQKSVQVAVGPISPF